MIKPLTWLRHQSLLGVFLFFSMTLSAQAAIDVNNSFSAATIYPGQNSVLTINLMNSSAVSATTTAFTNTLPTGVVVSATPNRTNTCGGTFSSTSNTLTLSGATIPASSGVNPGTCTLTINVTSNTKGTYTHQFNIGQVTAKNGTTSVSNTQISQGTLAVVLKDVKVDISIQLGASTDYSRFGASLLGNDTRMIKYEFTNENPVPLTGLTFASDLAASGSYTALVDDASKSNTCGGTFSITSSTKSYLSKSSISNGTIPANSTCTYIIKIRNSRPATDAYSESYIYDMIFLQAGQATTTQGASNTNTQSLSISINSGLKFYLYQGIGSADYASKIFNKQKYPTLNTRISITNSNLTPVSNFNFNYTLPTLAPATGNAIIQSVKANFCGGTVTPGTGGRSFTITGGTVPPATFQTTGSSIAGECYVELEVLYTDPGTYTWTIPAGALAGHNYNQVSEIVNITDQVLEVSTGFDGPAAQGDDSVLSFYLSNQSPTLNITNIDITNALTDMGDFVRIHPTQTPTTTCNGTLSTPANGTTIKLLDMSLAPNTTCRVNVPIKFASDAYFTNMFSDSRVTDTIPIGNITYDTASKTGNIYTIAPNSVTNLYRAINISANSLSFNPSTIGPLGQSRLQFTFARDSYDYSTNPNSQNSTSNLTLNYPLPSGHTISSTPDAYNTCGGTLTTTAGTNAIKLTGGSLPKVGANNTVSCTIAINIQAPAMTGSNLVETATFALYSDTHGSPVYFSAKDDGQAAPYNQLENYSYNHTILTRKVSSVTVNKEFLPVSINGGGKSRMRLTLSNIEPTSMDLSQVTLTDVFTTGIMLHTDVNPTFTDTSGKANTSGCMGASYTGAAGATSITLRNTSIKANSTCYFEFNVTAVKGGNHVDSIAIGDLKTFENISNNSAASATLTVGRNMNVANGFTPNVVATNETSQLAITISNANQAPTNHTGTTNTLTTDLPDGLQLVSTPTTTCTGATVSSSTTGTITTLKLSGGTFNAESSCKILADVKAANIGTYTQTIALGSLSTVAGATNSDASTTNLKVINRPTVTQSFTPPGIKKGDSTYLTLVLKNPTDVTLTNVSLSNTLSHMTLSNPLNLSGDCMGYKATGVGGGTSYSISNMMIPANGWCSMSINITSNEPGNWTNTINGLTSDQNKIPGDISTGTLVVYQPMTVTKSFNPTSIQLGQTSRLTFEITNPNAIMTNMTPGLTDPFPTVGAGIMKLAATPNIVKSCIQVQVRNLDNTRTAIADDTGIMLYGYVLPANTTCTISMNVTTTAVGTYVNNTSTLTSEGGVAPATSATLVVSSNSPPVITSNGGGATATITQPENQTSVTTVTATDADNDTLTYSLSSGADKALFSINATTGVLSFITAPDYEVPTDADGNNTYQVQVMVSDGKGGTDTQDISIVITDVVEVVTLKLRALLQGPYESTNELMNDTLRTLQLIPTAQPYTKAPFSYTGSETVSTTLLTVSGTSAIVDWVLVELRSATNPATIITRKAALLRRDGAIVEATTGGLDLSLAAATGSYYVVLRHRNHLGVMTATPLPLSMTATLVDFSNTSTATYGADARLTSGTKAVLWSGDANMSNQIIVEGPNNDASTILAAVLTSPLNVGTNTNYGLMGYRTTDVDMNGLTIFAGPDNELNLLVGNVLLHPKNKGLIPNYIIQGTLVGQ